MRTYEDNLAKIVEEEQELANVAHLLDLPVGVFPEIFNIQKEMKALQQIYDLYRAQKVCFSFSRAKQMKLHIHHFSFLICL